MALSGKDVDVTRVRSCKRFRRSSSCNKVVDMSVEVQRQETMVSNNRFGDDERQSHWSAVACEVDEYQC